MIKNFRDHNIEEIFNQYFVKKFPLDIQKTALRKLHLIDYADNINDLRIPPGNHLEKLYGDREGQYSIKINDTYRICFSVKNTNEFINVELTKHYK